MFILNENTVYPSKLESSAIIRFQDCDPLKHLNNAKYFDYFFNAREDQVANIYKFDPNEYFEAHHTTWVIYNHQIAYLNSAKVSERIIIISSIVYFNENMKITEFVMTDEKKQTLKAVLWTTAKYINIDTGQTTAHQPEINTYLNRIATQNINPAEVSFATRLKTIKADLKEGIYC